MSDEIKQPDPEPKKKKQQIFRQLQFSGPKMKELRLARSYSRKRLADELQVVTMTIYNWEIGKRVPSANLLWKMAETLSVKVTAFYE